MDIQDYADSYGYWGQVHEELITENWKCNCTGLSPKQKAAGSSYDKETKIKTTWECKPCYDRIQRLSKSLGL